MLTWSCGKGNRSSPKVRQVCLWPCPVTNVNLVCERVNVSVCVCMRVCVSERECVSVCVRVQSESQTGKSVALSCDRCKPCLCVYVKVRQVCLWPCPVTDVNLVCVCMCAV